MNHLELSEIQPLLTTCVFGRNLVLLPRVGSTNDVARDLAREGAPEGTVVVADEQTAGRGRLGRRWLAPPGTSLLCSILFRPNLPIPEIPRLTMLCSLAAADAVEGVAGLPVGIKWPNDLVVEARIPDPEARGWRKLAGLLAETGIVDERPDFAIVGVGINVNVPPRILSEVAPNATSILAETGRRADRASLLAALLGESEARYRQLRSGESPHVEWSSRLITLGRRVEATVPDGVLVGVAEAVDEYGALLLRTSDGTLRRLTAGDVTLS
ncbi:MAG: biotin--[acetyl-CoA-carboxylase] ligase [Anaerolineae bacterium]|jgi:BirA family biotin operon repressor/biotin-[acetyl-CoA-carboxylase] ligase